MTAVNVALERLAKHSEAAGAWVRDLPPSWNLTHFTRAYATAGRLVGTEALTLSTADVAALRCGRWHVDELARAGLLLAVAKTPSLELPELVEDCFRVGDNREKAAVLKVLPLLPEPARFVPLGVEACRTHVVPIFEAIACENPFPAEHFSELHFNQLVIKSVFLDVSVDRIVGLTRRHTAELRRMARDYAAERRAAQRVVSDDLRRLLEEAR